MARIGTRVFGGESKRTSRHLIDSSMAYIARDVDIISGAIRPTKEHLPVVSQEGNTFSIHAHTETGRIIQFPYFASTVESPIVGEIHDRLYVAGNGAPTVIANSGSEEEAEEYLLGVPQPFRKPEVDAVPLENTAWTRDWSYFYEEPDGSRVDEGVLVEGVDVQEVEAGKTYTTNVRARTEASADAVFVVWFRAYDSQGALIGQVYPEHAANSAQSDFFYGGKKVVMEQTDENGIATMQLAYQEVEGQDNSEDRRYVYTYVTAFGEEGRPSPLSDVVVVEPDQSVRVQILDNPPAGRNIEQMFIYRTAIATDGGTELRFVAAIDASERIYIDSIDDAGLGELLPSDDYNEPPELGGIAVMPTNFLVGFNGNEVVFSEVNQFHAWPIEYRYSLPYEVKAIAVYDNSVVAMTTAQPYLLTGYEPSVMSITEVTSGKPAFSQKGAADMGAMGIGFVSNDGFIVVSGTSAVNITEDQYSPEEWKAMEPGWMTAEYSNGRLYIFSELATLVADLNKGRNTWTRDSLICRSGFDDLARNRLLVVEPNNIQEWRGGENYRDGFWSSKQWLMPRAVSLGAFRVCTEATAELVIFVDGIERKRVMVKHNEVCKLPVLPRGRRWSFDIHLTAEVLSAYVATTTREILSWE